MEKLPEETREKKSTWDLLQQQASIDDKNYAPLTLN